MAAFEITLAAALFLSGVVTGIMIIVARAIHREDSRCTLAVEAPDVMAHGTRKLNGLARRDLDIEFLRPAS
jgi:hypothetical protein